MEAGESAAPANILEDDNEEEIESGELWGWGMASWVHACHAVRMSEHPESTWKPYACHNHLQFPWRRKVQTGDFLQLCGPASLTKAVENTQEGLS